MKFLFIRRACIPSNELCSHSTARVKRLIRVDYNYRNHPKRYQTSSTAQVKVNVVWRLSHRKWVIGQIQSNWAKKLVWFQRWPYSRKYAPRIISLCYKKEMFSIQHEHWHKILTSSKDVCRTAHAWKLQNFQWLIKNRKRRHKYTHHRESQIWPNPAMSVLKSKICHISVEAQ